MQKNISRKARLLIEPPFVPPSNEGGMSRRFRSGRGVGFVLGVSASGLRLVELAGLREKQFFRRLEHLVLKPHTSHLKPKTNPTTILRAPSLLLPPFFRKIFNIVKEVNHNITVLAAMSGGVDSSVAAALLVEQGYRVIGVTMKTYTFDEVGGNVGKETSCCGLDAINDARMVAVQLGIPHYVIDFTKEFRTAVIDDFVSEYLHGRTPNPCVICNREIKWGALLEKADALGAQYIATGHYARVGFDQIRQRFVLLRGVYQEKDQSYALWGLSQMALSRTLFPIGGMTKPEVRALAEKFGLKTASKGESFEICFVPDDNYRRFLKEQVPDLEPRVTGGDIILDDKVVGTHQGFPFYTIGQRRGFGAFGGKMYVAEIDSLKNTIRLGRNEALFHRELIASKVNLISLASMQTPMRVEAKVRYKDALSPATAQIMEDGRLRVEFDEAKRAITPGQSVVIYDGKELIVGGIIDSVF